MHACTPKGSHLHADVALYSMCSADDVEVLMSVLPLQQSCTFRRNTLQFKLSRAAQGSGFCEAAADRNEIASSGPQQWRLPVVDRDQLGPAGTRRKCGA